MFCLDLLILMQNICKQRPALNAVHKEVRFKIEIKTNLKTADFLDVTFNLTNNIYKQYEKPKDHAPSIH